MTVDPIAISGAALDALVEPVLITDAEGRLSRIELPLATPATTASGPAVRQAIEAGFDAHLTKPINLDELMALLAGDRSVDSARGSRVE